MDDAAENAATGDRKDLVDFVNNILNAGQRPEGRQAACFRLYRIMRTARSPRAPLLMRNAASLWMFPSGILTNCIQCNFCSYVCPHAVIRPVVMTEEEAAERSRGHEDCRI